MVEEVEGEDEEEEEEEVGEEEEEVWEVVLLVRVAIKCMCLYNPRP